MQMQQAGTIFDIYYSLHIISSYVYITHLEYVTFVADMYTCEIFCVFKKSILDLYFNNAFLNSECKLVFLMYVFKENILKSNKYLFLYLGIYNIYYLFSCMSMYFCIPADTVYIRCQFVTLIPNVCPVLTV